MLQQYVSAPIFVVSVEVPVFPVLLDKGEAPEKKLLETNGPSRGNYLYFFQFL